MLQAHCMYDMVIASEGAGKTLQLVNDFINLSRYEAIWILDDAAHGVWCMDFVSNIQPQPKFILIKPERFMPWEFLDLLLMLKSLDVDQHAMYIMSVLEKDTFFSTLTGFIEFYVTGNVSVHEDMYRDVLASCSTGTVVADLHPFPWWGWNPVLRSFVNGSRYY